MRHMSAKLQRLVGSEKAIIIWSKQDYEKWLKNVKSLISKYEKEMNEAWDALETMEAEIMRYPQNLDKHNDGINSFKDGSDGIQELISYFNSFSLNLIKDMLEEIEQEIEEME